MTSARAPAPDDTHHRVPAALSGLKRGSGMPHGMTSLAVERLKEINRRGDAAGLPPGLPTKLKACSPGAV